MRITRLAILAFLFVAAVIPTTLVCAQGVQLLINKAVYGKSGGGRDVTMLLKKMVSNGTLDVKVTNDNMGGDPNKGADKSLKVDYTFRGQRKRVVVNEGDRLKLP